MKQGSLVRMSTSNPYNILIFIGRFQPLHSGHTQVIDNALQLADKVLLLVGSTNRSRSTRNPFSFKERRNMIADTYPSEIFNSRLIVEPINDIMYNDTQWIEQAKSVINKKILQLANHQTPNIHLHGIQDVKIGLIGHAKDSSSFYLKLFPDFDSVNVQAISDIDATTIRSEYFFHHSDTWKQMVPGPVIGYLDNFMNSPMYQELCSEFEFEPQYKENVHNFPRIEHTVDAVVVQSGHVLMVRRRNRPGKGLWALPGGFLNQTEKLLDGAIRELREETKIKVPEPVLRGSVVTSKTYDDPFRSTRARIITNAFLIKLPDQTTLPKIKGSDDADKAKWVHLAELTPEECFEDHYFIIRDLVGKI